MDCKTLFVIGNGFDLCHGVQSRYEDFHKWLIANREWNRFKSIEHLFSLKIAVEVNGASARQPKLAG